MPDHANCRLCEAPSPGAAVCPACNRKRFAEYRGRTTARRLYTALKQRLRLRREERRQWTLADVEMVLQRWEPPRMLSNVEPRRLRIVHIDEEAPLIPSNARVEL